MLWHFFGVLSWSHFTAHLHAERSPVINFEKNQVIKAFLSGAMAYKWIPSRSRIQNWIYSKFIQILSILQIFALVLGFFILACFDGPYITAQIPALVPIFIMSFGLVSCILMEKVTLDYWKWKEEKIGRFLFGLCASISLVSSLVAVFICIT